jgi:hypothetical protein
MILTLLNAKNALFIYIFAGKTPSEKLESFEKLRILPIEK